MGRGLDGAGSLELRNEQRKNEGLGAEVRRKGQLIYSRRNGRGARMVEAGGGGGVFPEDGNTWIDGRADVSGTWTRRRVALC